ncbi:MAG: FHA domain-containing protein [Thermoplasmatota archaeon]
MGVDLAEMEAVFKALANQNRLQLLADLATPQAYADIRLSPTRDDHYGSSQRGISRPALRGHIQKLAALGLVSQLPDEDGRGALFVVNHGRLFALLEQARHISDVRPSIEVDEATALMPTASRAGRPEGHHLLLVRGVGQGRTFALAEEATIGRHPSCAVRLDYDPHVSTRHARIMVNGDQVLVQALPSGRNGTFVNDARVRPGGVAELRPGDTIAVGLSLLVYRD